MTTSAYHHESRTIAVDGRITHGTFIATDSGNKTMTRGNKTYFMAGTSADKEQFVSEHHEGKHNGDELNCVAIMTDGESAFMISRGETRYTTTKLTHNDAIGSGEQYAIAAMDFGDNAEQAVEYAATRDTCTGGKITVLKLGLDKKQQDGMNRAEEAEYMIASSRAQEIN